MPHAWVASDFIRSALDLFAYERAEDQSIVLAAGVPADWLDGDGIAVEHLRTAYGELSYALRRSDGKTVLQVEPGATPPGGFVLATPTAATARGVWIDGKRSDDRGGELRFRKAPARITIE
jgi:hypothetical protein